MWKKPKITESTSLRPVTDDEMNTISAEWSQGFCILIGCVCTSSTGKGLSAEFGVCLIWFGATTE